MFMNTVPSARYSEYEIIQHQKEELEMQNKRMVERISKLQFIYKGNYFGNHEIENSQIIYSDLALSPSRPAQTNHEVAKCRRGGRPAD